MKHYQPIIISLACLGLSADPTLSEPEGDSWNASDASAHADRYNDQELWKTDRLASDVEVMQAGLRGGSQFPFAFVAFPTPDYDLTGRICHGLSVGPLAVPAPLRGSFSAVNQPFDSSALPEGKNLWEEVVGEPLMCVIVSAPSPTEDSDYWAISRSHPHYFFQGYFASEHGKIDWSCISMEAGSQVGIINGRLLDLTQGNLILVRQRTDGSIRIFQHRTLVEPANHTGLAEQVDKLLATTEAKEFLSVR